MSQRCQQRTFAQPGSVTVVSLKGNIARSGYNVPCVLEVVCRTQRLGNALMNVHCWRSAVSEELGRRVGQFGVVQRAEMLALTILRKRVTPRVTERTLRKSESRRRDRLCAKNACEGHSRSSI